MLIYIIEISLLVLIVYVILNIYYYKKINKNIELLQMDSDTINKEKLIDYSVYIDYGDDWLSQQSALACSKKTKNISYGDEWWE